MSIVQPMFLLLMFRLTLAWDASATKGVDYSLYSSSSPSMTSSSVSNVGKRVTATVLIPNPSTKYFAVAARLGGLESDQSNVLKMQVPLTMKIIKSTYTEAKQKDDRRSIVETHIDDQGREHVSQYLSEPKADVAKMMADRVASIEASFAQAEAERAALDQSEAERAKILVEAGLKASDIAKIERIPIEQADAKVAELTDSAAIVGVTPNIAPEANP